MKTHQAIVVGAFSIAAAVSGWSAAKAQPARAAGPFTEAQATAGQAAYAQSCAVCHGRTLTGGGEAPPLVGAAFMDSWGTHSTQELFTSIRSRCRRRTRTAWDRIPTLDRRISSQSEWRAKWFDCDHAGHERAHRVSRNWRDAGRSACVNRRRPRRARRTWRRPGARRRRRLDGLGRAAFRSHGNRHGQELFGDHQKTCLRGRPMRIG